MNHEQISALLIGKKLMGFFSKSCNIPYVLKNLLARTDWGWSPNGYFRGFWLLPTWYFNCQTSYLWFPTKDASIHLYLIEKPKTMCLNKKHAQQLPNCSLVRVLGLNRKIGVFHCIKSLHFFKQLSLILTKNNSNLCVCKNIWEGNCNLQTWIKIYFKDFLFNNWRNYLWFPHIHCYFNVKSHWHGSFNFFTNNFQVL